MGVASSVQEISEAGTGVMASAWVAEPTDQSVFAGRVVASPAHLGRAEGQAQQQKCIIAVHANACTDRRPC